MNNQPDFKHLIKKEDGLWYFEGRRIDVFSNVFYFNDALFSISKQKWCEIYQFTPEAFDEALQCVEVFKKDYEEWIQKTLEEDSKDPEID
jgi:hypothetical protein